MQLFISTISFNPPVINLSGFVVLDRGVNTAVSSLLSNLRELMKDNLSSLNIRLFLFQLMSQMVTYLVVLMQFQLSSLDVKAARNNTNY
jgi:hypothetical protein